MPESTQLTFPEFEKQIHKWESSYMPVSVREMESWTGDIVTALERLPYQSSVKGLSNQTLDRLFAVRCYLHMKIGNFDMVYADLTRIWSGNLASECSIVIHGRRPMEEGFEFVFAAVDRRNCYVTGAIAVKGRV